MAHCYVVTAQPATSIIGSIVCNFTSPNSRDLIITKGNHLEVHCLSASSDGKTPVLHHFIDATMHGKIVSIDKYTPQNNSQQDSLFILTERKNFCILSYDNSTKKLITNCNGNVKDRIGREIETGICGLLDNQHNIIAMMVYEGLIKIFPIDPITNVIKESYNLRLEEIRYLDVKFLYGYSKPTFAILYEDARLNKHIKTYSIDVREKELLDGPWNQMYVDKSSIFLIPIPSPPSINGFCILVGIHTISYITGVGKGNAASNSVSILTNTTGGAGGLRIISYGIVDPDGSRFLLGDIHGNLHILALKREVSHVGAGCSNPVVVGLSLDTLGITSVANGISYLDKGIVYISSRFGDSQLIKILPDKIMSTEAGSGSNNHVQVLDVHTNIGPIVDMVVVNHDTKSTESSTTGDCNSLVEVDSNVTGASAQSQVVTCSGAYKDGSIRIIKSGIGFQEQAELEIPGIKGMWSLISSNTTSGKEVFDKYLVQSFISETRILSIDNEEMEECEIPGFNSEESTLFCTDICKNSAWMQVTPTTIRMVDNKSMCLIFSLRSDSYDGAVEGERFALATANQEQVVVSTTNSKLLYFEVVVEGDAMGTLQLTGVIPLEVDVACMSIRPPIYSSSSIETSDSSSDMEVDVSAPNVSSAMPPPPPIVDVHTNRKDSLIASQTSRAGASRSHSSYVGSVRSNTDDNDKGLGVHDMICPLGKANILAVGLWTEPSSVRLFSLPNLEEVSRVNLNNTTGGNTSTNTVQVRDVLLLELGPSLVVLLAGMGDGTLISHVVERGYRDVHSVSMADNTKNNHIELSSKRCVTLGSQPISLSCFCNNGILCVLAACDRPTVIYQQNNKLLFSIANINSSAGSAGGQISGVASFHTELFPEALALASASAGLSISTVGEIKKIHVQKYALNASPRRICHCSDFDLYVVLTQKMETNSAGVDITSENVVFLRETSSGGGEIMEQIHVHALDHMESGLSVVCTSFHSSNNDSSTKQYIVVGTAQSIVGEVEPSRGRMLVFDLNRTPGAKDGVGDIGISCIYEKEVKGAVFSLASIKGRLIAGIGSKVC